MPGSEFPAFLKLEHRPNAAARSSFLAELAGALDDGKRRFQEFSAEAKSQVDAALSIKRNEFGSLDLGIDDMKAAAQAQQARALAAREVATATATAAREQGDYSQQTRLAVAATEALAIEEERAAAKAISHAAAVEQVQAVLNRQKSATDALVTSTRRGTTESGNVINGIRAQRVAFTQLGQQMQDVVVQAQAGTSAMTIFVQQVPQAAFALSGLTESSNKFYRGIGSVATFLSGPWGAAIFAATAVLGPFIYHLIKGSDAADELKNKSLSLGDAFRQLETNTEAARKALEDYNAEQDKARDSADSMVRFHIRLADAAIAAAKATRELLAAELERREQTIRDQPLFGDPNAAESYQSGAAYGLADVLARQAKNQAVLDILEQNSRNLRITDAKREAEAAIDPIKAINDRYDFMAQAAERAASANDLLARSLATVLKGIEAARKAELDAERERQRISRSESRGGIRETAAFASPLRGTITGRFGEQRPGHRHAGIDIAAPTGTSVSAPQVGVVTAVGFSKTLGKYVVIDHGGGTQTRYGHLSDNSIVAKGDEVATGQVIGRVGSTGRSTGPHLHYEVRVNGKAVDPSKGTFPIDPAKVAENAQKAADRLQAFGDKAADRIARITDEFDQQPRIIDRATASFHELDDIITDLSKRKPPGFDKMIADAERAKETVLDFVPRIFRDLERDSQRAIGIQNLVSQGRDAEADALGRIYDLEERLGPLTEDRKQQIIATAEAEEQHRQALERAMEVQNAYLDATRSVRQEVEAILSGQGKLSNFKQIFKNLQGKVLAEQLFGDVFRDLDKWVKERTGIGSSVDAMAKEVDRSTAALSSFADAVTGVTGRITGGGAAAGGQDDDLGILRSSVASIGALLSSAGRFAITTGANDNGKVDPVTGEIVVEGRRASPPATVQFKGTALGLTPQEYFGNMSDALAGRLTNALNDVFDTSFFSKFKGVLGGALNGYATGGVPGGIIGAIKGVVDSQKTDLQKAFDKTFGDSGLSGTLGKALKGTGTGSQVAGIADAFGINLSNSGAQIGGAIGSFIPIPGGDIIGAIAGGIIGKLIGGTKRGSATIGGVDGNLGITGTRGNSNSFIKAASSAGDSIIASVGRIADAFGATVNAALGSVSIGIRDGKYRVDPTGSGITKTSKGAVDFGKDGAEAAARYAVLNLIQDGVIQGLRQGVQKIIQTAKDLDTGLQDALDFQSIFDRLKAFKDPVGAALDTVDREFTRLKALAVQAGEGMAEVEELYLIERKKAIDAAKRQITGSLQSLYDELTIGDSGLSIRARIANARSVYEPLAARVRSGDVTAYDDFAAAAQTLLPLVRQLEGSQGGYFSLFDEIKGLTKTALDSANAIAEASANRDSPFSGSAVPATDNSAVVSAIDAQTQAIIDALTAQGLANAQNTAALIQAIQSGALNDNVLNQVGNAGYY